LEYSLQLQNKQKNLLHACGIEPDVYSGREFGYRNKMEFLFNSDGPGLRRKDNSIINIDTCMIADDKINKILDELKPVRKSGELKALLYAVVRTASGSTSLSFVLNKESRHAHAAAEQLKQFHTKAGSLLITYSAGDSTSADYEIVKGTDMLEQDFMGKRFKYSVQGFFQANYEVAGMMHAYVHSLLEKYKGMHLLDLYAGVGTFGIINSRLFEDVLMVEGFSKCVESASANISTNKIPNAHAVLLDAKKLRSLKLKKPLAVLADPPRTGMHNDTIAALNRLEPESIVYVSCNIRQLKKDIPKFKKYRVINAGMFDQFPQTNHVEAVVELSKSAACSRNMQRQ